MSAFDNSSKPPTENQWHPMGSSFTTSGTQSTAPAPRETWAERMSRRVIQRRDPVATINLRLAQGPRDLKARAPRPQNDTGEQEEVDQLTAFRTGVFDSLDARNSSAP